MTIADGKMADRELSRARVVDSLSRGGFVSPDAEADVLIAAAGEGVGPLDELVRRRLGGEPLAWITGSVRFCGARIRVRPGVFVPRPHTETLAIRASALLPDDGNCVDLCTGSGAVAVVVMAAHPGGNVVGTDIDPVAVACARENGVDARLGDLDEPLPHSLHGRVDVMTAVVPYVPTEALHLLPRDVLAHEPRRALDGGDGGTAMLGRAAEAAARLVRPGGSVLLELGGTQADPVSARLRAPGFEAIRVHRDDDGFDRALEARKASTSSVEGREL
ncbi:MAG TPA: HemK/PrmC family methyltransferase [Actinomycetota bacterium]|nr:HemK/PrmC family methyltransferase [Actinomycetota bacterium]